jgi:hypothetical protein
MTIALFANLRMSSVVPESHFWAAVATALTERAVVADDTDNRYFVRYPV